MKLYGIIKQEFIGSAYNLAPRPVELFVTMKERDSKYNKLVEDIECVYTKFETTI